MATLGGAAGNKAQALRVGSTDTVTVGAASAQSNAVSDGIEVVRVVSTTDCYIAQGANPTATATTAYLPADVVEYFRVNRNMDDKFAVLQVSAGGTLFITEVD